MKQLLVAIEERLRVDLAAGVLLHDNASVYLSWVTQAAVRECKF